MDVPLIKWLKMCLSFRYISNFSIFIMILSYYMNAYDIFLLMIPLVITNFIVVMALQYFNIDELLVAVFDINSGDKEKDKKYLESVKPQFLLLNTLWHILPLIWIYYILGRDNLIHVFKPNFMKIFLQAMCIGLLYFYFSSSAKLYGAINYVAYMLGYITILLGVCVYLYL